MKLIEISEIKGKIKLLSGLHIGAGDMEMKIGGTDKAVVKHPHTNRPYIPGSSLKGKIRALLEMRSGLVAREDGKPLTFKLYKKLDSGSEEATQCEKILKLFGCSGADTDEDYNLGPCRLSFADCPLDSEWEREALEQNFAFTEVKAENSINRIKGTAENPRFTERVPSNTVFDFRVTIKKFEGDGDLLPFLLEGMKLLEMDALGGSGSRGYGRIKFELEGDIKSQFDVIYPM